EPKLPVKTAMVLLEFHQPRGKAWFDDISLTIGKETKNMLASAGFEKVDTFSMQAEKLSAFYEEQIQTLLSSIDTLLKSEAFQDSTILSLREKTDALVGLVTSNGLDAYFSRELRDLDDARNKLGLCTQLLALFPVSSIPENLANEDSVRK
ncbi:MAG: hypothetical protein KBI20_07920, partial [Sedimentibacter sp.]|nr:hypothetical protein [Sedimentibacter sp.]